MPLDHTGRVVVDPALCDRVADVLARLGVPEDREEGDSLPVPLDQIGNFYLVLVAICHQTQALYGSVGGRPVRGWDFLHAKWQEAVAREPDLLVPANWLSWTAESLSSLWEDPQAGQTLTVPEGRAQLVNDLGRVMLRERWDKLDDLYRLAGRRIASGSPNLFSLLGLFRAFNDPVRKKSVFLLGLMRNSAGWGYDDGD
jgi:hypothetical protein